ncbi:hypothetical protein F2Q70_00003688 [Brassica cretica]|uniref:Uncharacterized protein n=1 Tax=Brassica cretica TaxID=69181 RepID=A0A8S9IQC7_BRACR|nr:hypothetical protein F2Q70_00003688 [Brassica cretica]
MTNLCLRRPSKVSFFFNQTVDGFYAQERRKSVVIFYNEDDISWIRHEFDLAKQKFLNTPKALINMPKMQFSSFVAPEFDLYSDPDLVIFLLGIRVE